MCVVKELQVSPLHLYADVVRGLVANPSCRKMVKRHDVDVFIHTFFFHLLLLTTILVDASPDKQIEVEVSLTEDKVAAHLSVVADAGLYLDAIDIGSLFGDDVHHTSQSHTAIER